MKNEYAAVMDTIVTSIEGKKSELKKAEEAANRVLTLKLEIGALERAMAVLEGKDIRDFDRDRGTVFVGAGASRLILPASPIRANHVAVNTTPQIPRDLYRSEESIPEMVLKVLREAGKAMTGDEIMAALLVRDRSLSRPSVLGSVYRNAKAGRKFSLVKPGVFGLLEWDLEVERAASAGG